MSNYKLVIEYEGTRYSGWQEQKNARTVAGLLRGAIEPITGPIVELGGAGRTDRGVHALAQVAHLRLARDVDTEALRRATNQALPADIRVLQLARAAERFHARHAAESRAYLYQVTRRATALHRRFTWCVEDALDVEAMRRAVALVMGRHDFALFCERPKDEKSTLVTVERAEIGESGALVLVRFEATHFLWRMVRRLVGALVQVGAGRLSVEEFGALLRAQALPAGRGAVNEWTAASSGLFLERIRYPGDAALGEIQAITSVGTALDA